MTIGHNNPSSENFMTRSHIYVDALCCALQVSGVLFRSCVSGRTCWKYRRRSGRKNFMTLRGDLGDCGEYAEVEEDRLQF